MRKKIMEKNSNQPLNQAERYQYLIGLTEGKQLDADYRAAFYILSSVPEMFEAAAKCVDHEGITFDKIKRLCKGKLEESQMQQDKPYTTRTFQIRLSVVGSCLKCDLHIRWQHEGADTEK